jgi:hypothetical protein
LALLVYTNPPFIYSKAPVALNKIILILNHSTIRLSSRNIITGTHILAWAIILSLPYLFPAENGVHRLGPVPGPFFVLGGLVNIIVFYGNALFLYPRFLNKKFWWLYLLGVPVLLGGSVVVKFWMLVNWFPETREDPAIYPFMFGPSIGVFILSIIYRKVVDTIRHEKEQKEKKTQQLAAELKFLRFQINPHFLFNTLANMVSLARMKSDVLEPSLIKLSGLLRYSLYESDGEKVAVEKEIEYLQNYIELQQLRFGDDVDISLKIENKYPEAVIEPLLLISFIENAFKHGIGMVPQPYIQTFLRIEKRSISFGVENNYNPQNFSKDKNRGIGLANIKARLDLLYPGKHELKIEDDGNIYKMALNIDLS